MTPAGADKRRDKRLELRLPVKFSMEPEEHLTLLDGMTHNVSSGGVYFEAPAAQVAPDHSVWVRIGVPAAKEGDQPNLTLVGSGVVRRVETLDTDRVMGDWAQTQKAQGINGIALQFQQRPTIQLKSIEGLLWDDGHADR